MAKLYFRYGAMNSGKSTALLQAAYNYEERGQRVLLAKPEIDTKGASQIESRLGVTREVDFLIGEGADARALFYAERERVRNEVADELLPSDPEDVACLLIDEAQFLSAEQVDDLFRIAVLDGIPVMAYGIRNDFRTHAFPGSARLLAIAHALEELKTICRCGRKAVFNGRRAGGRFVFDGDQVAIDGVAVTYESLCGNCYLEESGGILG
ncbi:thymidine kinase [Microbacterium esteraromaticum]|uniref:Thymidine kinase n=1 Tax=Microbacterium esteraromaticum TaxID=57043 RepID=A0A939DXC6_9MICO|nr:thymidine kinase [Microbacterium esteraromaticum]MBN7794623.1 thymidine kinase [Microbacterium esteraromaticum]MBN8206712.1 thymidine kinase [Microbacterium esteraromaticum]MBN8416867.1 thymidine kinase [Microbacterium esteraromaticum]MBN8425494.1 thymidine kinase [Microbacterium esteraromaticum]MBY6061630.1 thymidine kinase [Microbacterium esteraromaticum]